MGLEPRHIKAFVGSVVGATVGFFVGFVIGKPIHDLFWDYDMHGDSAYFTLFLVMPLLMILGGTIVGLLCAGASVRTTIVWAGRVILVAAVGILALCCSGMVGHYLL